MSCFTFEGDGFSVSLPLLCLAASASAVVEQNGEALPIALSGAEEEPACRVLTLWGEARRLAFCREENGFLLRLFADCGIREPFLSLHAAVSNRSGAPVRLTRFVLLNGVLSAAPDGVIATPLLTPERPFLLSDTIAPFAVRDAVLLGTAEGGGLLVGSAGTGTSYLDLTVSRDAFTVSCAMRVLLEVGETRASEAVLFLPGETASLPARWAGVLGSLAGARLHRRPVSGWCSWYDQTTEITERHVREILAVCRAHRDTLPFDVLQIDDGYQKYDGDWTANAKFPSGMDALAADIRAAGLMAGKWAAPLIVNEHAPGWENVKSAVRRFDSSQGTAMMDDNPFHPLGAFWIDPTHPDGKRFLRGVAGETARQGYNYFKIDFNNVGTVFQDEKKTDFEAMRELYETYREGAGEEMYLLSCMAAPTRAVIGRCDALRVGPDSHPGGLRDSLDCVLRFAYCHRLWWNNDPDVTYLKPMVQGRRLWEIEGGLPQLRTWHSAVALSGGLALTSEPLEQPDARDAWRMMELLLPPVEERAQVYGLGSSLSQSKFGFTVRRPYGSFAVVLLWNDADEPARLTLTPEELGLPGGAYAVYSFWDNTVTFFGGEPFETPELPPEHSLHLRITPLDGSPALVGSSLHLGCGAREVESWLACADGLEIRLTDAGARSGSLFLVLPWTPGAVVSRGMRASLRQISGSLYELCLSERVRGAKEGNRVHIARRA